MNIDDKTIIKLVEDVTETKTLLQDDRVERRIRRQELDAHLREIKQYAGETRAKLETHLTRWQTAKRIYFGIFSLLGSALVFDFPGVAAKWAKLWVG